MILSITFLHIFQQGFERNPDAQLNPKKKIFEACAPDLKVNDEKIATYRGKISISNNIIPNFIYST